jgi:hypothetical protein
VQTLFFDETVPKSTVCSSTVLYGWLTVLFWKLNFWVSGAKNFEFKLDDTFELCI